MRRYKEGNKKSPVLTGRGIQKRAFTVFVNNITGKVDIIIPKDTGTAFIKLNLIKKAFYFLEVTVSAYGVNVVFNIVITAFTVVKGYKKYIVVKRLYTTYFWYHIITSGLIKPLLKAAAVF